MSATVTTSHNKTTRAYKEHRTSIVWHKAKSVVCIQLSLRMQQF